jgi:hypothetical protein
VSRKFVFIDGSLTKPNRSGNKLKLKKVATTSTLGGGARATRIRPQDNSEDVIVISKYGGFSDDEDQVEERAAAKAIRGPQTKPKVRNILIFLTLG